MYYLIKTNSHIKGIIVLPNAYTKRSYTKSAIAHSAIRSRFHVASTFPSDLAPALLIQILLANLFRWPVLYFHVLVLFFCNYSFECRATSRACVVLAASLVMEAQDQDSDEELGIKLKLLINNGFTLIQ